MRKLLTCMVPGILMIAVGVVAAPAQAQGPSRSPQAILAELTENIELDGGLMRRARNAPERLDHERSLAFDRMQRGMFYVLRLKQPDKGLEDLVAAAAIYRRQVQDETAHRHQAENRAALAQALVSQGLALRDLGKTDEAIARLTEAIEQYQQTIQDKEMKHEEPMLARAYETRAKILSGRPSAAQQAVADYDKAIEIVARWSQEPKYEKAFKGILARLQTAREQVKP